MSKDDCLTPRIRAEDILLGSLGLGEDASIVSIERQGIGYAGVAQWSDGDRFDFVYDDELSELETWALKVVLGEVPETEK